MRRQTIIKRLELIKCKIFAVLSEYYKIGQKKERIKRVKMKKKEKAKNNR